MKKSTIFVTIASLVGTPVFPQEAAGIELSSYINSLRQEFIALSSSGGADALPLYISPIQVELTASVRNEGEAGVKFYIIEAGGTVSGAATQKLSFTVTVGDPGDTLFKAQAPLYGMQDRGSVAAMDQLMRVPDGG